MICPLWWATTDACVKTVWKPYAAEEDEHHEQGDHDSDIADDVLSRSARERAGDGQATEVEAYQQVGGEAELHPAPTSAQVVVRQHQQQHGEDKEIHLGESADSRCLLAMLRRIDEGSCRTPVITSVIRDVAERVQDQSGI